MESKVILKSEYYILYYRFLELDKKSLLYGRDDQLILAFMLYYKALIEDKEETVNKIKDKMSEMFLERNMSPREINFDTKTIYIKNDLNLYSKFFLEALGMFNKFRKKIGKKNRENIAKKLLEDRLQYYNFFTLDVKTIVYEERDVTYFPLQVLNEFHNTMSHLCCVFMSIRASENNIKRAENHLQRAILDLYKVIIKDFFIIVSQDIIKEQNDAIQKIKNDIIEIRNLEYKTIGTDRITRKPSENNKSEENIFQKYEKVCEKIIDFFN
ncbi:hypothetical protein ACL9WK_001190 [Campylobacter jejuni]|uniref:hypothetical protein n=1 Tax=Campylobacter jejuni TaxID=197 RepID=UPI0005CE3FD8|nr:hypothetical protein [Campylobacter jejuni]KJD22864.1 hypothetical protein TM42_03380 [Campylobacter jejuni subsp. jejuni]KJD96646.1 hypothetical protein TM36_08250 [Campylobacter jejuni subsp. jejuni]